MFDPASRYANLETVQATDVEGRRIAYKRRRFLPNGSDLPLLAEAIVQQGDRLDLIAARTLGDAEHFWRVCDANNAMNPSDLTAEIGQILRVPVPQP